MRIEQELARTVEPSMAINDGNGDVTLPPMLLQKSVVRVTVVAGLHLAFFEGIQQFAIHWRESSEELCSMALYVVTFMALMWAVSPGFARTKVVFISVLTGIAAIALFAALFAGDYFYSWHLRPNLGLYQEPEWVQQHPGFQRELRQRIAANLWRGGQESTVQSGPK